MSHRPCLSVDTVKTLAQDLYGLHVLNVEELDSFDDRNYHLMVDADSICNDHVENVCREGYVLKVMNSTESKNPEYIRAKNNVIQHSCDKGIRTPRLVPSRCGQLFVMKLLNKENDILDHSTESQNDQSMHAVRLLEFISGITLATVPLTSDLCFQVGLNAALVNVALKDFDNKKSPKFLHVRAVQNVPSLRPFLHVINDADLASLVHDVIDTFEAKVLKCEYGHAFRKGYIHGDFNAHNILVSSSATQSQNSWNFCGILDFGSLPQTYLFVEVAIAMSYMMAACPQGTTDALKLVGHTLAGYLSKIPLSRPEVDLLPLTMCTRYCQTVVFGHRTALSDPDNRDYLTAHLAPALTRLPALWNTPSSDILGVWKDVVESRGLEFPV